MFAPGITGCHETFQRDLGRCQASTTGYSHDLVARSVARVRRLALGFHPRDRQPRPAALTTGVLSLGELTRREAGRLQSSVSDQQVDHKHDQQNTAELGNARTRAPRQSCAASDWRRRAAAAAGAAASYATRYSKIGTSTATPRTVSWPIGTSLAGSSGSACATSPEITQATPYAFAASSIRSAMLIVLP